ncbi:MAG: pitrilysin family protein [Candidatus Nanopelagicales bacterium]|nr:pitrilysin family protein [Candidatus Nanopelagicales bacterium]
MASFFPAAQQQAGTTKVLLRDSDGSVVRRTVMPTGLRVISDSVPGVRSVTIGVWAAAGSRDETAISAGAAHFLEHLLFKGTPSRSALQIASEVDGVGGELNAFTAKEYTCFYARVQDRDLRVAVDLLMDVTTGALLRTEDIEAERSVVLEEISMHEDDPADVAHEHLQRLVLKPSRLARPILGTRQSITDMSPGVIRSFFRRKYKPEDLVIAAAGNVDHKDLVRLVAAFCERLDLPTAVAPTDHAVLRRTCAGPSRTRSAVRIGTWPGEQCHLTMGTAGLPRIHPDRRALDLLDVIVGGGMSSRLFQSVRERHGLAYSVYSFHTPYSDGGVWGVAAGCNPDKVLDVLSLVREELDLVLSGGLSGDEIARAKGHLSGALVLAGEDGGARMSRLGRCEVGVGELLSVDEALGRIEAVTIEDLQRLAESVLTRPLTISVVGPLEDDDRTRGELVAAVSPE